MPDPVLTSDEVEQAATRYKVAEAKYLAITEGKQWHREATTPTSVIGESLADIPALCQTVRGLRAENEQLDVNVVELRRQLLLRSGEFPCAQCGGPHNFDTSVPSAVWNQVIRARGLPDYLCMTCLVREFVRAGRGFTAQLYNEEFSGVNIEVLVEGKAAQDAALVSDENTSLRVKVRELHEQLAAVTQERDQFSELADKRHDELCEARRQRDSLAANYVTYTRDAMTAAIKDFRAHAVQLCKDKAAEWKALADDSLPNDQTAARLAASARSATELSQLLERME